MSRETTTTPDPADPQEIVAVASWLVALEPSTEEAVRASLALLDGAEARATVGGRLVVVSECPSHQIESFAERLRSIEGVMDVALVAAHEDRPEEAPL